MKLSEPVILARREELAAARTGKLGGADDPLAPPVLAASRQQGSSSHNPRNLISLSARTGSLCRSQFGLACCAIEILMQVSMPRYDVERFGCAPRRANRT